MSDSVWPHRQQPTRLPHPWDSPGKNTGVGCHFLLQYMKVKSESEVTQLCPTISDPMDCSLPGSSVHRIFQARVLEWGAIAFMWLPKIKATLSNLFGRSYEVSSKLIWWRKCMCNFRRPLYWERKNYICHPFFLLMDGVRCDDWVWPAVLALEVKMYGWRWWNNKIE